MAEQTKPDSLGPLQLLKMVVAGVGAVVLSWNACLNLFVPAVTAFVIFVALQNVPKPRRTPVNAAVALQGGQLIWGLICLIYLQQFDPRLAAKANFTPLLLEVVIAGAAVVWLAIKPNLVVVILLIGYQLVALVVNVTVLCRVPFGNQVAWASVAAILLRTCALIALGRSVAVLLSKAPPPARIPGRIHFGPRPASSGPGATDAADVKSEPLS